MKRSGLFLGLLLWAALASAQLSIGGRAGINFAGADIRPLEGVELGSEAGLLAGALLEIGLGNNFFIQPEATYLRRGYSAERSILGNNIITKTEVEINYLDLGGLLKAKFGERSFAAYLAAGAFYSQALDGQVTTSSSGIEVTSDIDFEGEYERSDINLSFGGGLQIGILFLDIRYLIGLEDIEPRDPELEIKNRGLGLSAGLLFQL